MTLMGITCLHVWSCRCPLHQLLTPWSTSCFKIIFNIISIVNIFLSKNILTVDLWFLRYLNTFQPPKLHGLSDVFGVPVQNLKHGASCTALLLSLGSTFSSAVITPVVRSSAVTVLGAFMKHQLHFLLTLPLPGFPGCFCPCL